MKCEVSGCDCDAVALTVLVERLCMKGHAYVTSHGAEVLEPPTELNLALAAKAVAKTIPCAQPWRAEDLVMPFGKFKGERIEDIPLSYLTWAAEELDGKLSPVIMEEIENQLALKQGRGVSRRR